MQKVVGQGEPTAHVMFSSAYLTSHTVGGHCFPFRRVMNIWFPASSIAACPPYAAAKDANKAISIDHGLRLQRFSARGVHLSVAAPLLAISEILMPDLCIPAPQYIIGSSPCYQTLTHSFNPSRTRYKMTAKLLVEHTCHLPVRQRSRCICILQWLSPKIMLCFLG